MRSTYAAGYRRMLTRLRASREAAGLTQSAVSQHFGRRQSFTSKVESGERRIDPVELWSLAKLYGKSVMYFLDDEPEPAGDARTAPWI
jgi:transcriptional regulator with XRE-family HTH domain